MEGRLFYIGVFMGAYVWLTNFFKRRDYLASRVTNALWHAVFWMSAAFGAGVVIAMSFESRSGFAAGGGTTLLPAVCALLVGSWSFWHGYTGGKEAKERAGFLQEDLEWGETIFSAVLLAAFLMYFILQAFKIPSGSMRPTLLEGDHLFVNKFIYGVRVPLTAKRVARFKKISRGDIVVFQFPSDDEKEAHCGSSQYGKDFIKRAVALEGDKVEVRNGTLLVNDVVQEEPYTRYIDAQRIPNPASGLDAEAYQGIWQTRGLDRALGDSIRDYFGPIRVPQGSYFMMGDNRDRSCDSRFWGPVPDRYVKGKAWFIYWPVPRMKTLQ